ncbi:MAG: M14 family metallopeptidase [Candidatus Paceibacterota bacterium]
MGKKKIAIIIISFVLLFSLVLVIFIGEGTEEPEDEVLEDEPEPEEVAEWPAKQVIGHSVEGREIEEYRFVSEEEEALVVFVGGIHGGYEWNSVLLAYQFIDHLEADPETVPEGVSVSIIPSLNPDGVVSVIGKEGRFTKEDVPINGNTKVGRMNANGVDLNRNFDCNWQPESSWRGEAVSAGSEVFSEPEAQAVRDLVEENDPDAVIFWHSAAGAVYGSECNNGILQGTIDIMNAYAEASGYSAVESFDHYEITGDAEGWLASVGIPSVTVELSTHNDLEWERNLAGVRSVLDHFK